MSTSIDLGQTVAFVTGANRGLGLAFVKALRDRGANKIYAAARDTSTLPAGVHPVRLDVTNPADVEAAARGCGDVTLLINNAGITRSSAFLVPGGVEAARAELETNYFGPLAMARAFAPALAANGGGAIVNVLSVLSWMSFPSEATYSASKAAAWSLTNGLRTELRGQGTRVVALHVAFMDTDMAAGVNVPKTAPSDVARLALDALVAGDDEVLADDITRGVKQGLSAERGVYLSPPGVA